jgi:flagellar basal body P-ring formation protein FlgA
MDVKALTVPACVFIGSLFIGSLFIGSRAMAQAAAQPLASIRTGAENAVRRSLDRNVSGVELEAVALDPRLALPACGAALSSFVPELRANQSRLPVRMGCASPAWSINVPVEIRRTHEVLVMKRAVSRAQSIDVADVEVQKRVLPGLASPFVASPAELKGRVTRRPVPAGTALPADALTAALLIHRGQNVTLAAISNGIEVRAPGLALADAPAQGRVRVQNLNSLKVIEGVADTEGVVRVTF